MDFSSLPVTHQKKIPMNYLDFLGHMNVMYYTHLFDQGTFNFYEEFGFGAEYHTKSGFGSFALERHTRYLAEVHVGEMVKIYSRFIGRGEKVFHFFHFMVNEDTEKLAATTELIGIHIDMKTRRSSPLPENIAAKFDAVIAKHKALDWEAPLCGVMGID